MRVVCWVCDHCRKCAPIRKFCRSIDGPKERRSQKYSHQQTGGKGQGRSNLLPVSCCSEQNMGSLQCPLFACKDRARGTCQVQLRASLSLCKLPAAGGAVARSRRVETRPPCSQLVFQTIAAPSSPPPLCLPMTPSPMRFPPVLLFSTIPNR